jgi:predicted PurR-regulated permease PerM
MNFTKEQFQSAIWLLVGVALVMLLFTLGPVLTPFVAGAILAYTLNPFVDRLCRIKIGKWVMPRAVAVLIAMISLLSCILALILIVLPVVENEIPLLQDQIPKFLDQLNTMLEPKLLEYNIHAGTTIGLKRSADCSRGPILNTSRWHSNTGINRKCVTDSHGVVLPAGRLACGY